LGSFFRRFMAKPIGSLVLSSLAPLSLRREDARKDILKRAKRLRKFVGSSLELVIYTGFFLAGLRLLAKQTWIWPSKLWWDETPSNALSVDLAFFYLAYASRYMAQFVFVLFDPRKSDFLEMQTHHVVTVTLVCLSYAYGMVRIGLIIMVVFDCADIFLHSAKLCKYCEEACDESQARARTIFASLADVLFGLFALTFFLTRICVFSYLVYSVTVESFTFMSVEKDFYKGLFSVSKATHVCVVLVWALCVLQWFWFNLLVKLIIKTVQGDELKDNRSDLEDLDDTVIPPPPPAKAGRLEKLD
jgi:hypothetical protein